VPSTPAVLPAAGISTLFDAPIGCITAAGADTAMRRSDKQARVRMAYCAVPLTASSSQASPVTLLIVEP